MATVFQPAYEKQIDQISSLGAPKGDEQEVGAYLNSLQKRVGELSKATDAKEFFVEPFAEPKQTAAAAGLNGCAESLF
jgi:hypothetical protein